MVNGIVGHRITDAFYYALNYGFEEDWKTPNWRREDLHDIDYGLELELETGAIFGFTWDTEFNFSHSLSIIDRPITRFVSHAVVWNVTHDKSWAHLINREVLKAEITWDWYQAGNIPEIEYPLSVTLHFEEARILFIGAYSFHGETSIYPGGDNIVIVFDRETIQKYGLL